MLNVKQKIYELTELLNKYRKEYYEQDNPSISDVEYDSLMHTLEDLEKKYPEYILPSSPTRKVGYVPSSQFQKVVFKQPMLSLGDIFNYQEVRAFAERIYKSGFHPTFVCELKIDGIASSMHYTKGIFKSGSTRGNGLVGEDISDNLKMIETLPKILNVDFDFEVRGEVYMKKSVFSQNNAQRKAEGLDLFKNCRNAAGGSLRQLDPQVVKERKLDSFVYTLVEPEKLGIKTQSEALAFFKDAGFSVNPNWRLCKDVDDIIAYLNYWEKARTELDYDTDGVVIKVNEFALYDKIGYTVRTPKWGIAYKFPAKVVETQLLDIVYSVGRTGNITPNAVLEPVFISGSEVKRATLNNEDFCLKKDIRIGDYVTVRKAGEIIPEVVSVNLARRKEGLKPFQMIEKCPVCGSPLARKENESLHFCLNDDCSGRKIANLIYFASRPAMNIEGLGEAAINDFYNLGYLNSYLDIYRLKDRYADLIKLEGYGKKSIEMILKNIEASKNNTLEQVITAFGIRYVGSKIAKVLAKSLKSLQALLTVKEEELLRIPEIGEKIAQSVVKYVGMNKDMILALIDLGINPRYEDITKSHLLYQGKMLVLTGKLEKYTRDEATKIIEDLGGSVSASVSRKTFLVVAGSDAGSKLAKAKALGIKVIGEDEFIKEVGDAKIH